MSLLPVQPVCTGWGWCPLCGVVNGGPVHIWFAAARLYAVAPPLSSGCLLSANRCRGGDVSAWGAGASVPPLLGGRSSRRYSVVRRPVSLPPPWISPGDRWGLRSPPCFRRGGALVACCPCGCSSPPRRGWRSGPSPRPVVEGAPPWRPGHLVARLPAKWPGRCAAAGRRLPDWRAAGYSAVLVVVLVGLFVAFGGAAL